VKSKAFAVRIVRLCRYLGERGKEHVITGQLFRSGTRIGANVREAANGQSKKDFIYKMSLALKGCAETEYWLELLHETECIDEKQFRSIDGDCQELLCILVAIVETARENEKAGLKMKNEQRRAEWRIGLAAKNSRSVTQPCNGGVPCF
jgi:four helix bundle protein